MRIQECMGPLLEDSNLWNRPTRPTIVLAGHISKIVLLNRFEALRNGLPGCVF